MALRIVEKINSIQYSDTCLSKATCTIYPAGPFGIRKEIEMDRSFVCPFSAIRKISDPVYPSKFVTFKQGFLFETIKL